jgi:putative oxygen-independent coproporphyrinogen III oxidase
MSSLDKPGLYVHVPFCRSKCLHCNFYSVTTPHAVTRWLAALRQESLLYRERFATFDSLYLGGGTPTLLSEAELKNLLDCLFHYFSFSADPEITVEANPDDISSAKLAALRDLGINRLSLGVQSFDDRALQFLGRSHSVRQAVKALDLIRVSGFTNLGVDLIYAIPGQSESDWVETMKKALAWKPEHLSCYQLTIEEDTPLGRMAAAGRIESLGEEQERSLFLLTSSFLEENGYIHYEISNFARGEKFASRHNRKYWHHTPYLGLGPSAHSFLNGVRWWNIRSVDDYCRMLADGRSSVAGRETLSGEQQLLEALYLGFRTRDGIDLELIRNRLPCEEILKQLQRSALVRINGNRVIPTRKGFLVADRLPLLFCA